MGNLNTWIGTGNLVYDTTVEYVKEKDRSVMRFVLATNEYVGKGRPELTHFIKCELWGALAEIIHPIKKGTHVGIEGTLASKRRKSADGLNFNEMKIKVTKIEIGKISG